MDSFRRTQRNREVEHMDEKTDPVAFLKRIGSEPYPLTEKQKELIKFIEENPNIKLTMSGLLKPGSNSSVKTLQGRSNKPPQVFYDETESDLYDLETGEPIDLEE